MADGVVGTGTRARHPVRERLSHPVVDVDGHTIEYEPGVVECLAEVAGGAMVDRYLAERERARARGWNLLTPEQRRDVRALRGTWWLQPGDTLDRATATLPRLLYERLDELGIDVTVLYPTLGFRAMSESDPEVRVASIRAINTYAARAYDGLGDRIIPVATIPMDTPAEAISELDYVVGTLGMRAVVLEEYRRRPIPAVASAAPEVAGLASWVDVLALDSPYDYDPVWARCEALGVTPTFHSAGFGFGTRHSISNYMYNHIGHFASAHEAMCKALFFSGVPKRFPGLRFAFLEGGIGWAVGLREDLVSRWKKRNGEAVMQYSSSNIDPELLHSLCAEYGDAPADEMAAYLARNATGETEQDPEFLDEFAAAGVSGPDDIRHTFATSFYFGCEADDPLIAMAFDPRFNQPGTAPRPVIGSDIGHWDVTDMAGVLDVAFELVEHGLLTDDQFREFVFTNPVELLTSVNPHFFDGTVIEAQAAELAR